MSSFQNRAPRLNLSFPLEFQCEDGLVVKGHCLNLSESGLLAIFDQALDLWTTGDVVLQGGDGACEVPARVARAADSEVGLAFSFRTETQRQAVRSLLALAAEKTHLVGAPPF